ncbi:hypothetical protein [Lysinibacter cavernae]|uniref:Uncharacterized protein n=1 Tax=Lysinibacter cavernae TaxID=1640652 RepID=A0A7X5TSD5_9MICO|nr:hypothetical protein [Lysinibacter cavernae]NIH52870.1 hypothetical protein [Lysinibacter cavernae]
MSTPETWIPHNREDGELVGWILPEGDGFVTFDLLGRQHTAHPVDWLDAEQALEALGIGYLANIYAYRVSADDWARVRIVELSTEGVTVKEDDYGDVVADLPRYRLPFPVTDDLRLLEDAPGPVRGQFN